MRVITGCCWPKGISRGGVLAACCEGSRPCRSRTGSEPGETANRALRSDPGGQVSAARQVGGEKQTNQVSETAKRTAMRPEGGSVDLSLTREGGRRRDFA